MYERQLWLEILVTVLLAAAGFAIGERVSKSRRVWWLCGYAIPMLFVVSIALAGRVQTLQFVAPFSWLMKGRTEHLLIELLAPLMLGTLAPRLPRARTRRAIGVFAFFMSSFFVLSFAWPLLVRSEVVEFTTRFDADGICRQSTRYSCGPAAAVTALGFIGIPADERELAWHARTSPFTGTQTDDLCDAVLARYGDIGVQCEYRRFDRLDELQGQLPAIVSIRWTLIFDHFVAILDITEDEVVAGDPIGGLTTWPREEFEQIWRRRGFAISRSPAR